MVNPLQYFPHRNKRIIFETQYPLKIRYGALRETPYWLEYRFAITDKQLLPKSSCSQVAYIGLKLSDTQVDFRPSAISTADNQLVGGRHCSPNQCLQINAAARYRGNEYRKTIQSYYFFRFRFRALCLSTKKVKV